MHAGPKIKISPLQAVSITTCIRSTVIRRRRRGKMSFPAGLGGGGGLSYGVCTSGSTIVLGRTQLNPSFASPRF